MAHVESTQFLEDARNRKIPLVPAPDNRVVITAARMITPFGDNDQTWQAIMDGRSAIRRIPNVVNFYTNLGAPLPENYDPIKLAGVDRVSRIAAMSILLAREAGIEAGLLTQGGTVDPEVINSYKLGVWVGSGVTETPFLIDVYLHLHKWQRGRKITGVGLDNVLAVPRSRRERDRLARMVERLRENSRRIPLDYVLSSFPEQLTGDTARITGAQGHSGDTSEACATSASNIAQGYEAILLGHNSAVIAGGFEDALYHHPEVAFGLFGTGVRALSRRLHDPEGASRPFAIDRDGFVPASGGAIVVLESERHARSRGAKISAEVVSVRKGVDGGDKSKLDPVRVADLIGATLYNPVADRLRKPDAIFAHATSTKEGDPLEAEALYRVFGNDLADIPVTAVKSYLGHLLGGAGAVNIVLAVMALQKGIVPAIRNLDNPDPKILDLYPLNLIRGQHLSRQLNSILATAYGFGGFNTIVELARYIP